MFNKNNFFSFKILSKGLPSSTMNKRNNKKMLPRVVKTIQTFVTISTSFISAALSFEICGLLVLRISTGAAHGIKLGKWII